MAGTAASRWTRTTVAADGYSIDTPKDWTAVPLGGQNLDALIETSVWLEGLLGRRLEGQVYRAGKWAGG